MITEHLEDDLRVLLSSLLLVPPASIGPNITFKELGVDSMMQLEMIAHVEQMIGRELIESELPKFQTIEEVVGYVQSLDTN